MHDLTGQFTEEIMKVQEYALQLIEAKKYGLSSVDIEQHEYAICQLIESLQSYRTSSENFYKLWKEVAIERRL